jgi:ribosomal protein L37AE/L43A
MFDNEPSECPECDENALRWDVTSGHWDCVGCGWTTQENENENKEKNNV